MTETRYFTTEDKDLYKAAELIKEGGLVAFPTETVYGLGGNALDPAAARKIYEAKGRPSDNPLIVHISDIGQIEALAEEFPPMARALAEALWPGPMTLVLKKKAVVPDETTGGLATVAIRMPASKAALKLITKSGCPIAAPSANLSGHPSPTRWQHVKEDLNGRIDAVIMGEPCMGGIESTVIDMTEDLPQILRPGLITPERITEILGVPCSYDPAILGRPEEGLVPKAPGMKYKHYAPKAKMLLFEGSREQVVKTITQRAAEYRSRGWSVAELLYEDSTRAAECLFADLRRCDEEGTDIILAMALSEEESVGFSVMNRMLKSAGYHIEHV
ncbi:MAG: threonylcarbamoyl-AMP synthase [Firmicutes bacterium]|nr:threonylcarbamoyl-AMP synthase [Bacillota bacterium]